MRLTSDTLWMGSMAVGATWGLAMALKAARCLLGGKRYRYSFWDGFSHHELMKLSRPGVHMQLAGGATMAAGCASTLAGLLEASGYILFFAGFFIHLVAYVLFHSPDEPPSEPGPPGRR